MWSDFGEKKETGREYVDCRKVWVNVVGTWLGVG